MIKNYNPNSGNAVHTVRITLMYHDYVGHIAYEIGGNAKGADLLDANCIGYDTQEDIERYVENDCAFSVDEDYDCYRATLHNENGDTLEVDGDADEMRDMVVSIEFSAVVVVN